MRHFSHNRYISSLVGLSVLILVILIGIVVGMRGYFVRSSSTEAKNTAVEQSETLKKESTAKAHHTSGFPKASVGDWGVIPASPSFVSPARVTIFSLKQQYNRLEFENVAQHFLSMVGNKISENDKSISVVSSGVDTAAFYMYKPSGSFMYASSNGISLPSKGSTESQKVTNFLENIWTDGTLQVTSSYERLSTPGVRYYEIHRDWDKVGLPIINLMGMFNISDSDKVGAMSLSKQSGTPSDLDIVNTDNNADGRLRSNDFNTATVGVRDGRIVSVVSNIRPARVQASRVYGLISYTEAVEKLKKNAYVYLYTSPAGQGVANSEMLYPNNSVSLTDVSISESFAAYLEELPNAPQTQLYPYYVFRGTALSETGYRMNFIAAVAAAAATDTLGAVSTKDVRLFAQGTQNGFTQSQQQGTLDFVDPTDSPPPALSQPPDYVPSPIPPAPTVERLQCTPPPAPQDLWSTRTDVHGYTYGIWGNKVPGYGEWYIVTGSGWDVATLERAVAQITSSIDLVPDEQGHIRRVRDVSRIIEDFSGAAAGCPIRISGASPALFLYGPTPSEFRIVTGAEVTYSDPPVWGNQWIAKPGSRIYYEYTPIKFSKSKSGWTVSKRNLDNVSQQISTKLALTANESTQLRHEFVNTARHIDADTVTVEIIPQKELDEKLPLIIDGQTTVVRYHFVISAADKKHTVSEPQLNPIIRSERMAVELGASAQ